MRSAEHTVVFPWLVVKLPSHGHLKITHAEVVKNIASGGRRRGQDGLASGLKVGLRHPGFSS